ncbi:MAG: OsmC family protein [Bacteroidetes bacterium]|nr:OsmC family protein [Bacteroidota bacterium]
MTSKVEYKGQLRMLCTHSASQSVLETDAPTDNHGKGERFSPTDLTATSLASCMLTVMGIKARSMGFDLEGIQVGVRKTMASNPRRIQGIELTFEIPEALQNIEPKTIELLKKIGDTCPVRHSLHPDIQVQVDWGIWS